MSEITVREYQSEDREGVEKCIFELQEDEKVREPHYWGDPKVITSPYLDYVLNAAVTEEGKIYVAEIDGQVVGFTAVMLSREEDSPAVILKRFGYVMDLDVLRAYQGKGAGVALMRQAEEYVKQKGLEWIQLDVTKNNPAHKFYLNAGYTEKNIRLEKKLK